MPSQTEAYFRPVDRSVGLLTACTPADTRVLVRGRRASRTRSSAPFFDHRHSTRPRPASLACFGYRPLPISESSSSGVTGQLGHLVIGSGSPGPYDSNSLPQPLHTVMVGSEGSGRTGSPQPDSAKQATNRARIFTALYCGSTDIQTGSAGSRATASASGTTSTLGSRIALSAASHIA
jgi:hypothetical protein